MVQFINVLMQPLFFTFSLLESNGETEQHQAHLDVLVLLNVQFDVQFSRAVLPSAGTSCRSAGPNVRRPLIKVVGK